MKGLVIFAMLVAVTYGQFSGTYTTFNQAGGANCGNRPLYTGPPTEFIPDYRVVGGNGSTVGDHYWMVVLLYNGALRCGGAIINPRTVLNAAHCTVNTNAALMAFWRVHTRNSAETWAQNRPARTIVNHPSYSSSTYNNDISIIILSTPFNFDNTYVGPICLGEFAPPEMARAIATGWGSTQSGGSVVQPLREAYMPITPHATVVQQYGSAYYPATMIGAALIGDGLDTCQGDSGGPLSSHCNGAASGDAKLNKICEVGIVSWGYGCGNVGIYSRVQAYLPWIEQSCLAQNCLDP